MGWRSACLPKDPQSPVRGTKIMTDHRDRLKCPLCEGHGEVRRSQLIELFSDPELKNKVEHYMSLVVPPEKNEPLAVTTSPKRDFQKDVHNWNPQVPMWTRSPKE